MKNSFVRFILVGIVNTIVGLSCMYLFLHAVHFSYWTSTFLGNSIGACVSYFLNKSFTFKSEGSWRKSALRFILVILCCYFISYDVAKKAVMLLLESNQLFSGEVKTDLAVLVGTGLYTILNYFGQKVIVFSKRTQKI